MTEHVLEQVELELRSAEGARLALLRIASANYGDLAVLPVAEAKHWAEHPIQLREGASYDYELLRSSPEHRLRPGVAKANALSSDNIERGRLLPGLHTGSLRIVLENLVGAEIAHAYVEVRSIKLDYRSDYRALLDAVSLRATNLLFDVRAPASAPMATDPARSATAIAQQFMFLRSIFETAELSKIMGQILANSHEAMKSEETARPISRGFSATGSLGRQIASEHPRITSPANLTRRFATLPARVTAPRSTPTIDTPENRFVKIALRTVEDFLSGIQRKLRATQGFEYLGEEIARYRSDISALLSQPFFRRIGNHLTTLPYGSAVLQKRAGYREFLQFWMRFNAAAALSWDGSDELFAAGKRDVARLYEYWVFFELLDAVQAEFELANLSTASLVEWDRQRLSLRLKAGNNRVLSGVATLPAGALQVSLSFNRSFLRKPNPTGDPERSFPSAGSWTKPMRPDYTVSLWPVGLSEADAELSERIFHLHFDAKYRAETLLQLFGDEDPDLITAEYSGGNQTSGPKRDDLLKMHSYRDAIRRSVSAVVLYPGTEHQRWREFEQLLPGLGAIALVPGNDQGQRELRQFLREAATQAAAQLSD